MSPIWVHWKGFGVIFGGIPDGTIFLYWEADESGAVAELSRWSCFLAQGRRKYGWDTLQFSPHPGETGVSSSCEWAGSGIHQIIILDLRDGEIGCGWIQSPKYIFVGISNKLFNDDICYTGRKAFFKGRKCTQIKLILYVEAYITISGTDVPFRDGASEDKVASRWSIQHVKDLSWVFYRDLDEGRIWNYHCYHCWNYV